MTAYESEAGAWVTKIHSNRAEIKVNSDLATITYMRRLKVGTTRTQTTRAMSDLLNLNLSYGSKSAVLEFILRYKELSTRLGDKLPADCGTVAS